jgi:hypothetical protein
MALITLSVINFPTYKKYGAIPPAVLINYPAPGQTVYFDRAIYNQQEDTEIVLDWVTIYDITSQSAKVKLNTSLDNYTPGPISKTIEISTADEFWNVDPADWNYTPLGYFTINVTIEDTILLTVAPTSAAFQFEIGGIAPVNKNITVTAENNWTVTKTAGWVNLPTTSGSNTGTFQIGVTTTGLATGIYNDIITVNDGVTTKTIAVSLTVTDAITGTDFLYITPTLLNFGYSSGGEIPPQKTIELNTSAAWTATADQAWVNVPTASGVAGAAVVPIALQNISALAVGEHFATVVFTIGNINKTVTIQLTVYEFITELLTEGYLYFCDDDNFIKVSSSRLDTFMQLELSTFYNSKNYNIPFSIPYFNGTTQKRIGSTPKKLIGNQSVVGFAEAALFNPYPTISLDIVIQELELFTKNLVQTQTINNVRFVKGKKPIINWISDSPTKIYRTKTAIVYFSIISKGVAASTIEITGAFTKTFNFAPITSDLLTIAVPLADVGALNVGDQITIEVLGNSLEVVIKEEGIENSVIYWENKWGVWDTIECTGDISIEDSFTRSTLTTRKTELTTETKIIDVTKPISYKINTGELHTDAEVETISKLLESKNIYAKVNNTLVKVNPTSNKITPFITDRELRAFDLTFNNVIE